MLHRRGGLYLDAEDVPLVRLQALLRPCDTLVLARDWCPESWRGGGAKLTWRDKWGVCNHTSVQISFMAALPLTLTPILTPTLTSNLAPNLTRAPTRTRIRTQTPTPTPTPTRCRSPSWPRCQATPSSAAHCSAPCATSRRATTGQVTSYLLTYLRACLLAYLLTLSRWANIRAR